MRWRGLGCTPAELTWKSGVDVMSFGATKNGAMMLEAVVFFDLALAEDFAYRRMRAGQLLSKSRYLGAQMLAYLDGGLWLENARRANALAQKLAKGLTAGGKVRIPNPVQANEVFAVLPQGDVRPAAGERARSSTTGCPTASVAPSPMTRCSRASCCPSRRRRTRWIAFVKLVAEG